MTPRTVRALAGVLAAALVALVTPALAGSHTPADPLQVGVGRADITPPTGYFTMGNVRSDARAEGQHTRLFARAIVLERDGRKVALVVADLCCVAGGLLTEAAKILHDRGFDEGNLVVSATHTHSAPGQYFPFGSYDTTLPNVQTATQVSGQPDPQLYGFLAQRLAAAIARADDDLGPGAAGWGHTQIDHGLTQNRSIEAHLANFGIERGLGEGNPGQDPKGLNNTIDPALDVLRVDKRLDDRLVPVGMWSTFANHGTVNLGKFSKNYNGDHLAPAMLATEAAIRQAGGAPAGQEVVSAFSNADEGDSSSALDRTGPAQAEYVGRVEGAAMMRAWTAAGENLSLTPLLDWRWTRFCFCGQETEGGPVDDKPVLGVPLLTGSDEHRGQLYDNTGLVLEGRRLPTEVGPQGHKIQLMPQGSDIPRGAPIAVLRVGDGAIVSNPAEVTVEVGRRIKAATLGALAGTGVTSVAITGLANEYLGYVTTPEEYRWQAYEGAMTAFGTYTANLLRDQTAALARTLASGAPAPAAFAFDPTNGLLPDFTPFPTGAPVASPVAQPDDVARLARARFSWTGGPRGTDRPLDKAFVTVQRRERGEWRDVFSDLGTTITWRVTGDEAVPLGPGYVKKATTGTYDAQWEVPLTSGAGTYRFAVSAKRYAISSEPFEVGRTMGLKVVPVRAQGGRAAFRLDYPVANPYEDFTYRPVSAAGGQATVRVGTRTVVLRAGRDGLFELRVRPGETVEVLAAAARDAYGNTNAEAVWFIAGSVTTEPHVEPFPVLSGR